MQKITREALVQKAVSLLSDGTVTQILGWKKGEFDYVTISSVKGEKVTDMVKVYVMD